MSQAALSKIEHLESTRSLHKPYNLMISSAGRGRGFPFSVLVDDEDGNQARSFCARLSIKVFETFGSQHLTTTKGDKRLMKCLVRQSLCPTSLTHRAGLLTDNMNLCILIGIVLIYFQAAHRQQ
jgi:hypothetical protein